MSTDNGARNGENQSDVKATGKKDWDRPWTNEEEESWNRAQKAAVRGIVVVPEQINGCTDEEVWKLATLRAYNWEEYYKCHVASKAKFVTSAHKEINAQGFLDKYVYNYGVEQLPDRLKKIYYDAWLKQQSSAVSNVRSANNKAVQKAWCQLKEAGSELSYTSQIKENIRRVESIEYARMLYHVSSKICYNSSDVMKSFHKWNERSDINSIITVADEAYTIFLLQNYETHYKRRWKWTKKHKVRFGANDFKKKATKEEQRAAMPLWNFQRSTKSQSGISPVRNGGFTMEGMQQYMLHHTMITAKREKEGAEFNEAFGAHLWSISKEIWPDDEDEWFGFDASKPVGEQYIQKRKRRLKAPCESAPIRYKLDINDMPC